MRQSREAELSPLVTDWLKGMGYSVYSEISDIDHVGVRWSDESIICVEMKTALTRKVLYQAGQRQLITPAVYAAVPGKPRSESLKQAAKYGIGVWACGRVIAEPCDRWADRDDLRQRYRERILGLCRRSIEGGIGGLPTLKGDGPAIRCAAAVKAYRAANPRARWVEIWQNVPNHYAHFRSMQGALRDKLLTDATHSV